MDLFHPSLMPYLDELVPNRPEELSKMEAHAADTSFPIVGPASANACYLLAKLIGAKRVFELGSGYGYSTAWFARAVQENGGGEVHHVVWDEDLSQRARGHLGVLGFDGIVRYTVGEAVAALRETPGPFDLIFNDIDKTMYPDSIPLIHERLRPGGLLIMDNVLWSGKIFDEDDTSPATDAIREATRLVANNPSWTMTVLPIRDGLLVAMKR